MFDGHRGFSEMGLLLGSPRSRAYRVREAGLTVSWGPFSDLTIYGNYHILA